MLTRIGALLRQERHAQDLTLKDLSKLSGISTSMISAVERGERNVTMQTLLALSEALKVHFSLEIEGNLHPQDEHTLERLRRLLPGLDPAHRATLLLLLDGWEKSKSLGDNCQENVKKHTG